MERKRNGFIKGLGFTEMIAKIMALDFLYDCGNVGFAVKPSSE